MLSSGRIGKVSLEEIIMLGINELEGNGERGMGGIRGSSIVVLRIKSLGKGEKKALLQKIRDV